jgi:hypothetical protein
MSLSDIELITNHINKKEPCIFAKYGDGEYLASLGATGANCDNTPYTSKLQKAMNESFIYISQQKNSYLGQYNGSTFTHWDTFTSLPKKWANYHLFIFYGKSDFSNEKRELYKAIKYSSCQKIYVCNESMVEKSKSLLNIDNHIIVDKNNWFENNFDSILNNVLNSIKDEKNVIILTSAGMGAKPLISSIHKNAPNAIILDIGSALDLICTGHPTRSFHNVEHTYSDLTNFFNYI